jgi:RHS repeat-associated protein
LVKLTAGGVTVATYAYDGLNRRGVANTYSGGVLTETRHFFFSHQWQVIEERIGSTSTPDRQSVWGMRFFDSLVLRDRDAVASGFLNERLYAIQDDRTNITAISDPSGTIVERYEYSSYGFVSVLNDDFSARMATAYEWDYYSACCRLDAESSTYHVRYRQFHPVLGVFLQRDPLGVADAVNLYDFSGSNPINAVDPLGLFWWLLGQQCVIPRPLIEPIAPTFPRIYVPGPRPPFQTPVPIPPPVIIPRVTVEPRPVGPNPQYFPADIPVARPWRYPGDGTRPDSDCNPDQLNRYNAEVNRNCHGIPNPPYTPLPTCSSLAAAFWFCSTLEEARRRNSECAYWRRRRENICFRGGDRGHRVQLALIEYQLAYCYYRLRARGCPGYGPPPPNPGEDNPTMA